MASSLGWQSQEHSGEKPAQKNKEEEEEKHQKINMNYRMETEKRQKRFFLPKKQNLCSNILLCFMLKLVLWVFILFYAVVHSHKHQKHAHDHHLNIYVIGP